MLFRMKYSINCLNIITFDLIYCVEYFFLKNHYHNFLLKIFLFKIIINYKIYNVCRLIQLFRVVAPFWMVTFHLIVIEWDIGTKYEDNYIHISLLFWIYIYSFLASTKYYG